MFCNFWKFNIKSFKNKKIIWNQERLIMVSVGKDIEQQESTLVSRNINWHKPGKLFDSTHPRLDICLPNDPAISLLNIYLTNVRTHAQTFTKMFEAALVVKALTWKQSKCTLMRINEQVVFYSHNK